MTSEQTGMFYPLVRRGAYVEQGMKIGYVTDYLAIGSSKRARQQRGVDSFTFAQCPQ